MRLAPIDSYICMLNPCRVPASIMTEREMNHEKQEGKLSSSQLSQCWSKFLEALTQGLFILDIFKSSPFLKKNSGDHHYNTTCTIKLKVWLHQNYFAKYV